MNNCGAETPEKLSGLLLLSLVSLQLMWYKLRGTGQLTATAQGAALIITVFLQQSV